MKTINSWWIVVAATLPVVACAHKQHVINDLRLGSPESTVYIDVVNHYNGPVEIHAAGSGMSYRVGTVLPGFSSRFALRQIMIASGPVEVVARSGNGNAAVRSGRLLLAAGDVVQFRIATHPLNSSATVRQAQR